MKLVRPDIYCLCIGCLVSTAAACRNDATTHEMVAPAVSNAAPDANRPAPLQDADITRAIQRHLQEDAVLRSEHVQAAVTEGVAVLGGSVSNILAKERAVDLVGTLRGVRTIVDQVVVTPVDRSDRQIEADVKAALRGDVATRHNTIGVVSLDRRVTLTGTTESWSQKNLFADVAKTVPGVTAIDNAVVFHYGSTRPELEIAADVRSHIANDVWLDGTSLVVKVNGDRVSLSGVVGSVAQHDLARADAFVSAVVDVDAGGVTVDWRAFDDQRRTSTYATRADADLAQAVRDALRLDPRLKTLIPMVAVKSGMATLTGTVDSPKARRAAASDAKNTVGVWSVRNEVLVQMDGKPTDADIERAVKQALSEDLVLSYAKSIEVTTVNGRVTLKGTIPLGVDRFFVLADVEEVPGVADVEDNLTVKRLPADIEASVEDRLFWDPMVERNVVHVAVAPDGITTLTGTVATWSELKAASNDALAGGAARVINLLKLNGHPELVVP